MMIVTSLAECFEDASLDTTALTPTTEHGTVFLTCMCSAVCHAYLCRVVLYFLVPLSSMKFVHHGEFIVAVADVTPGGFFYHSTLRTTNIT